MWMYGDVTTQEAAGEVLKCALSRILEVAVDGMVHIEIENDGSFEVRAPDSANAEGQFSAERR